MPDVEHLIVRCLAADIYCDYFNEIVMHYGYEEVIEAELYLIVNCKSLINTLI